MNGSNDLPGRHCQVSCQVRTTVLFESTRLELTPADLSGQPDDVCFCRQKQRYVSATPTCRFWTQGGRTESKLSSCSASMSGLIMHAVNDFARGTAWHQRSLSDLRMSLMFPSSSAFYAAPGLSHGRLNCRGKLCRRLLRLILYHFTPRRDGPVSWLQRAETCSLEWSIPTATSSTRCTSIRPAGMAAWDRSCSVRLSDKSNVHTRLRVWKCAASTPGRALSTHAGDGWKCGVIRELNAGARSRMSRCRGLFECSAAQGCLGATGRCEYPNADNGGVFAV